MKILTSVIALSEEEIVEAVSMSFDFNADKVPKYVVFHFLSINFINWRFQIESERNKMFL